MFDTAINSDYPVAVAKIAPPVAVSTAIQLGGVSLQDWVLLATLLYTVLQIASLIYNKLKGPEDGSK